MVLRERRAWYPRLARLRKMKLNLRKTKVSSRKRGGGRNAKKTAAVTKKKAAKPTAKPTARRDSSARVAKETAAATPSAPAGESPLSPPAAWHPRPPLLAGRLRELLFGHAPESSFHPTASADTSLADKEALSWLFPAMHNGEWFGTLGEFVEHCGSVSHKLLCESAPLFPLVISRNRQSCATTHSVAPKLETTVRGVEHVNSSRNENTKRGSGDATKSVAHVCNHSTQEAYYWWLMRIHTALVDFGCQEWRHLWLKSGGVVRPLDLRHVGKVWCCYRVFQTAVADAVARRLALFSRVEWQTLCGAAAGIARVVLEVYMNMPHGPSFLHLFTEMDDGVTCRTAPHADGIVSTSIDATTPDAAAMHAVVAADVKRVLVGSERDVIVSLSAHLATVVMRVFQPGGDVLDLAAAEVASLHRGRQSPSPVLPSVDNSEEERIMALVLWLHLCSSAAHSVLAQ